MAKHSDEQAEGNDEKLRENVAAGNKRMLLYVHAMQGVRELAADSGKVPTGTRMEALRLADWLLQVLTNTGEPNERSTKIIDSMTAVMHGENLDKQDRYVIACGHIETAAIAYRDSKTDAARGYAALWLASLLYGLDRKFSAYMISNVFPTHFERSKGHVHLVNLLATWVPDDTKPTIGHRHTSGLLATLCVETGAFDANQCKPNTPKFKSEVDKLSGKIRTKVKNLTRK